MSKYGSSWIRARVRHSVMAGVGKNMWLTTAKESLISQESGFDEDRYNAYKYWKIDGRRYKKVDRCKRLGQLRNVT